jgi:hypothetical protein
MSCAITSKCLVTRILLGLARRPGVAGGAVTAVPAGRAARWGHCGRRADHTGRAGMAMAHLTHDKPASAGPRREACTCLAPADTYCLRGDWPSDPCDLIYGSRGRSSQRCRSSACPAARNSRPRVPAAVVPSALTGALTRKTVKTARGILTPAQPCRRRNRTHSSDSECDTCVALQVSGSGGRRFTDMLLV